jgi:hypothetical protein
MQCVFVCGAMPGQFGSFIGDHTSTYGANRGTTCSAYARHCTVVGCDCHANRLTMTFLPRAFASATARTYCSAWMGQRLSIAMMRTQLAPT